MSRRKEKGRKHDGRSRVSNDVYRKRWNEIFNKKDKCVVITDASFKSRDYDTEDK